MDDKDQLSQLDNEKENKPRRTVVYIFALIILLALGIIGYWFYQIEVINLPKVLTAKVPTNYSECLQNSKSEHNKASCTIFYFMSSNNSEECLNMGGCNPAAADGANGCKISFFNPNLEYPENYQDCKNLYGDKNATSVNVFNGLCSFFLNSACSGNKSESRAVLDKCPQDYAANKYEKFGTCEKVFSEE